MCELLVCEGVLDSDVCTTRPAFVGRDIAVLEKL